MKHKECQKCKKGNGESTLFRVYVRLLDGDSRIEGVWFCRHHGLVGTKGEKID